MGGGCWAVWNEWEAKGSANVTAWSSMESHPSTSPGPGWNHRSFLVLCRARGAQGLVALPGDAEPQPRQTPSCPCPSEGTDSALSCPQQHSPGPEHLLGHGKGLAKGKILPRSPFSLLRSEPRAEFGWEVQL